MKNIKMRAVPEDKIAGFDPSAMKLNRSHKTKTDALRKVTPAQIKALKLKDNELFVMLLLASVGMVSHAQIKALMTIVPEGATRTGFDGMMSEFQRRFGITFDPRKAVGTQHSEDTTSNFIWRMASKKNLVKTVLQGGNVHVSSELAGQGVEVAVMLTNFGASVLLALTTRKDLTVSDIKFCVHNSRIGLDTQIHDLGASSFLTGICVASALNTHHETNPIICDVVQTIGDGKNFEVNGVTVFRPDLSIIQFIQSVHIPFYLEWNTEKSSSKSVIKKTKAYLQLMMNTTEKWAYGRPWLIFAIRSGESIGLYQKAIREGVDFTGLLNARTYNPLEWAGIAVATYGDLGALSPIGGVYRVFDFKTSKLSDEKFTLVSLCQKNYLAAEKVVETPRATPAPLVTANEQCGSHSPALVLNGGE